MVAVEEKRSSISWLQWRRKGAVYHGCSGGEKEQYAIIYESCTSIGAEAKSSSKESSIYNRYISN